MAGSVIKYSIINRLPAAFRQFEREVIVDAQECLRQYLIRFNDKVLKYTPVWEGDTVLNWRWSTLGFQGEHEAPRGSGPPGNTNSMPLGAEPRRAINEQRPRRSLIGALNGKPMSDFYLTNTADSALALEYGRLPTPLNSRVDPSRGIVRLAIAEMLAGI